VLKMQSETGDQMLDEKEVEDTFAADFNVFLDQESSRDSWETQYMQFCS
jgi:hypothetical protein